MHNTLRKHIGSVRGEEGRNQNKQKQTNLRYVRYNVNTHLLHLKQEDNIGKIFIPVTVAFGQITLK